MLGSWVEMREQSACMQHVSLRSWSCSRSYVLLHTYYQLSSPIEEVMVDLASATTQDTFPSEDHGQKGNNFGLWFSFFLQRKAGLDLLYLAALTRDSDA